MEMTVRLTVVGFAALMLMSLADAQGAIWHYQPDSLVKMPHVTFAPQQQHLAQQYMSPQPAARNHGAGATSRSP
jgi:hypothetical protein